MDDVAKGWLQHRMVLHELLDLVDDAYTNFKPWDHAFSISELALHTVTTTDMFIKAIKNGSFAQPSVEDDYETIDDVRKIVNKYTETTKKEIKAIYDFQLKSGIEFNDVRAPGTYWLSNAIDHEIHHKGQLFTYVRIIGVEDVPFFVKQPSEV